MYLATVFAASSAYGLNKGLYRWLGFPRRSGIVYDMTAHANCNHPTTPAARRACRKWKAERETILSRMELVTYLERCAMTPEQRDACDYTEWDCVMSGIENADATAEEQGFEYRSDAWFDSAFGSIEFMLNCHGYNLEPVIEKARKYRAPRD